MFKGSRQVKAAMGEKNKTQMKKVKCVKDLMKGE